MRKTPHMKMVSPIARAIQCACGTEQNAKINIPNGNSTAAKHAA